MAVYRQLLVWQKAMELTKESYQVARLLPKEELGKMPGSMILRIKI